MTLQDFLSAPGRSNAKFATDVRADPSMISRIRRGISTPSADLMRRIYEATEGQVTPNDFVLAITIANEGVAA